MDISTAADKYEALDNSAGFTERCRNEKVGGYGIDKHGCRVGRSSRLGDFREFWMRRCVL